LSRSIALRSIPRSIAAATMAILGGIAGPGPAIVRQLGVAAGGGRRE
jgi:hypothetical protein